MLTPKFFGQGDNKNRDLLKKPLSAVLCGFLTTKRLGKFEQERFASVFDAHQRVTDLWSDIK